MNKLKKSLEINEISFGTWIQIPHPSIIEIIAANSGGKLDWMCIDMEHGMIDIESMTDLIRTIESEYITPIVRIPKNDYIWIHRVLDAGAKGIVVPMVKNMMEANAAVEEAKYPPKGKRSFGFSRANTYGSCFGEYIQDANDDISIILQIEHKEAIANLYGILGSPNIDGTFIGPLDLAGSMGLLDDMNGNEFTKTLERYRDMSSDLNVPTGIHIIRPNETNIAKARKEGYKIIALGLDDVFLAEKCKEIFGII